LIVIQSCVIQSGVWVKIQSEFQRQNSRFFLADKAGTRLTPPKAQGIIFLKTGFVL
jgi:hypothetical protein